MSFNFPQSTVSAELNALVQEQINHDEAKRAAQKAARALKMPLGIISIDAPGFIAGAIELEKAWDTARLESLAQHRPALDAIQGKVADNYAHLQTLEIDRARAAAGGDFAKARELSDEAKRVENLVIPPLEKQLAEGRYQLTSALARLDKFWLEKFESHHAAFVELQTAALEAMKLVRFELWQPVARARHAVATSRRAVDGANEEVYQATAAVEQARAAATGRMNY